MFLKNRNIISKIRRSKVTDYAALIVTDVCDKTVKNIRMECKINAADFVFYQCEEYACMLYENCVKITVQQSLPFSYTTGKYANTTCRYKTHQIHVTARVRLIKTYEP